MRNIYVYPGKFTSKIDAQLRVKLRNWAYLSENYA